MYDLTGFQRDCLVVIAGLDEPKGLEIKGELDDYYGAGVNHGRLYPNLDTLVDLDLVKKGKIDDRTNSYELTSDGESVITDRYEWENQYVEL